MERRQKGADRRCGEREIRAYNMRLCLVHRIRQSRHHIACQTCVLHPPLDQTPWLNAPQLDTLREQYETGQEGWRAAIAERSRRELTEREAALREKLARERDEEIEVCVGGTYRGGGRGGEDL